jgi:hypothetical protein
MSNSMQHINLASQGIPCVGWLILRFCTFRCGWVRTYVRHVKMTSEHYVWYSRTHTVEASSVWCTLSQSCGVILRTGWIRVAVTLHTCIGSSPEELEFDSRQGQEFFLLHIVKTGSGAHQASYPVDTGGSFPGVKAARAWSWPLTSN